MPNANRTIHNPTTGRSESRNYALIGMVGALVVLGGTFLIVGILGPGEELSEFTKRWEKAMESHKALEYRELWDSEALKTNRNEYERASKLVRRKSRIDADVSHLTPRKEIGYDNRFKIGHVPVRLYQDGEMLMTLYRDLVVERKKFSRRWKLISDSIGDDPVYPPAESDPSEIALKDSNDDETETDRPKSSLGTESKATKKGTQLTPLRPVKTSEKSPKKLSPNKPSRSEKNRSDVSKVPMDTQLKLSQVLGDWQRAWENKDIEQYMAKYADDATITRVTVIGGKEHPITLGKNDLRNKMRRLNKHYSKIQVKISNLKISGDEAVADVGFLQEFSGVPSSGGGSPVYHDYGTKSLKFMVDPKDGTWKIYSESWKLYKGVPKFPKL